MQTLKIGRNNLAATIFVPYDCDNNCPFCTSKKDYSDKSNFSLENIIQSIKLLNKKSSIKEYVITGGEPFADLDKLLTILEAMEGKDVYINTTLPLSTAYASIELINNYDKIKGVSISRHLWDFNCVAPLELINTIKKSVRINCILPKYSKENRQKIDNFIHYWGAKKRDVNLREDYQKQTTQSLFTRTEWFCYLADEYLFVERESCMVCNTEYFSVNNDFFVSYHRGIKYSSLYSEKSLYVIDIIVKQDGNIYFDWDKRTCELFENWLKTPD